MDQTTDLGIPNYRIIRELGRGGMGVVYLATQESLGREVAVKVLPIAEVRQVLVQRFLREVEMCLTLSNPHLVKFLDAGSTDRWAFLAMEVIDGVSLDHWLFDHGAMRAHQLLAAMEDLTDALDLVHSRGIVHRDLKPANVMVPRSGGMKLMDFGLARCEGSATITDDGQVVGSPRYLAPETVLRGVMDPVSDLYGLGFMFYEMSTAARPYTGYNLKETLKRIVNEPLPPPSRLEPSIPAEVDRLILRLVDKNPGKRFADAKAVLDEIRRIRGSEDFIGTSWETSRPELNLSSSSMSLSPDQRAVVADGPAPPATEETPAAVAPVGHGVAERRPSVPEPGQPLGAAHLDPTAPGAGGLRSSRPSRASRSIRSTQRTVVQAGRFSSRTLRLVWIGCGLFLVALVLVLSIHRAVTRPPTVEAVHDRRVPLIDRLAVETTRLTRREPGERPPLLLLIKELERQIGTRAALIRGATGPEARRRLKDGRSRAIALLSSRPFHRPYVELTGLDPATDPAEGDEAAAGPVGPLLADSRLPLEARLKAYEALLVLSQIDD